MEQDEQIDVAYLAMAHAAIERGMRQHYVYFCLATYPVDEDGIGSDLEPLIKIGTTTNVEQRMKGIARGDTKGADWLELGIGNLSLLGYIEGDREVERHLHKSFAKHRAGGEWFWYEPIAKHIDDLLDALCACEMCTFIDCLHSQPLEVQRPFMDRIDQLMRASASPEVPPNPAQ